MKFIHTSKRLLFVNLLCLLWLPNYCDIKQNEDDNQGSILYSESPSDGSDRAEILSSEHKKEKLLELETPVKEIFVQPSVEYVNNLEKENAESSTSEKIPGFKVPQPNLLLEELSQKELSDLESSRLTSNEVLVEGTLLPENSKQIVERKSNTADEPTPNKPNLIEPFLTAPNVESSLHPQPLEERHNMPDVTIASTSIPSQSEETPVRKTVTKLPFKVPVSPTSDKPASEAIHQQPHYDGMPSFDEWKKMMLAEQEKGGQKIPIPIPPGKKIASQKRRRNYSSYECGAKIVASNAEAEGTSRILNELVDEYMLNPCKAKIWFVIELCETVQATQIELANFELFSSCPRDFAVYSSDNFPTRDWILLGTFSAVEQRLLQSFELKQEGFGKFIKIELLGYYGKEHYCPLSVVRIFGTSMVDEYEEMETLASQPIVPEDELDRLDISLDDKKATNLFNSATDAVLNIVKKAAQALGQHKPVQDGKNDSVPEHNVSEAKQCKFADNTSDKCEENVPKPEVEKILEQPNFLISPSKMSYSLFRLLHRCDQCSSGIRYYSSAQPHCRFFQAAFGPVVFKNLCDWYKEHPHLFAQESSQIKDSTPQSDPLVTAPPAKSPPPQVIIVPLENDTALKKNASVGSLDSTVVSINTSEDIKLLNNVSQTVLLDLTSQSLANEDKTVAFNHSKISTSSVEFVESFKPGNNTMQELPTAVIPDETVSDTAESVLIETSFPDSATTEFFPEPDEEQIKEFISEEPDAISVTEMPAVLKLTDMKNVNQGKQEPIPVSTAGQKESVFMRMSNRIKSLELNMSLSSQYLQELSQRYRRQMDEMQRAFNRTIGTLNDTAKKAAERDLRQQDILNVLQVKVANLTETVDVLLKERTSLFRQMVETHVCLMVIEAIVMITVMSLCVRRIALPASPVPSPLVHEPIVASSPRLSKRRSSVDSCCSPPIARKVKKRSASEEALTAGDVSSKEPLTVFIEPLKAKKKNRKRSRVQRSVSNPTVQCRNTVTTSQTDGQLASHKDGSMLKSTRTKHQFHRKNNSCENCIDAACMLVKHRRANGGPLQNLTNGNMFGSQEPSSRTQILGKGKFSFRKFLKFQKRDSI